MKHRLDIAGHVIALEFTSGDQNGCTLLPRTPGPQRTLDASAIAAIHRDVHMRLAASCRDFGLRNPYQLHAVQNRPQRLSYGRGHLRR